MSGDCGCGGSGAQEAGNRPGLGAIRYRARTHATFLDAMRTRLSAAEFDGLAGLRTHDVGDPSVALLDAWAAVGDVLTFYQERIANEGYLRTATERRSVLELARLIGYTARPGVAASVYLAYTVDKAAGPVPIPKGSRANNIPGPGETMQAFETSEDLEARAEWSRIGVRRTRPQTMVSIIANGLYLAGTTTNLAPGDALLIDFKPAPGLLVPFRVAAVDPDDEHRRTRVELAEWTPGTDRVRVLREELSRFRNLDAFGITHAGASAKRTLTVLDALAKKSGGAKATPAVVAAAAADALERLRAELAAAHENQFARLVPWLSAIVAVVARAHEIAVAAGPRGVAAGSVEVGELIGRLRLPPSVPPRTGRDLRRSTAATFAPGSDIFPSLLAAGTPSLYAALASLPVTAPSPIVVYAMRQAAALFGHNAPLEQHFDDGQVLAPTEWKVDGEEADVAFLDNAYPKVIAGTPVVVQRPADTGGGVTAIVSKVDSATVGSRSAYGLAGKTTELKLADEWWEPGREGDGDGEGDDREDIDVTLRRTTVYCQSDVLARADEPITEDLCGDEVELDGLYDGLRSGRWMIVSGERADVATRGVHTSELVMVAGVRHTTSVVLENDVEVPLPGDALHTFVTFAKKLEFCYYRETVVLHGNVVPATHGETRTEVLGGGNPATTLQTFELKARPLTFTSAQTASGIVSSLQVRVGEVRWDEAGSLLKLDSSGRGFVTSNDDEQKTSVVFGDGEHGARPPTGFDNITATYRTGIGAPGNVAPDQISLLATKPLGVTGVVNPIRAAGGAGPEGRDDIRRNAPLAVTALDRLVGIGDYADFARTFAGIGKAAAVRLSDGTREVVHVTIAGAGDGPVDIASDLYANLRAALRRYGDPYLPIQVAVRELLVVSVTAGVRVRPEYRWATVEPALRAALLDAFGFDRRELGQDLVPSTVLAVMQAVPGVQYVDLDDLSAIAEESLVAGIAGESPAPLQLSADTVRVRPARLGDDGRILPAQLAYLQPAVPDTLILNEVKA